MLKIVLGLYGLLSCVAAQTDAVEVKWLEGTPDYLGGVTFGLPWPRGQHQANATSFTASGGAQLQSWVTAYWPDGSLKWTGHALGATTSPADGYTITATGKPGNATFSRRSPSVMAILAISGCGMYRISNNVPSSAVVLRK